MKFKIFYKKALTIIQMYGIILVQGGTRKESYNGKSEEKEKTKGGK